MRSRQYSWCSAIRSGSMAPSCTSRAGDGAANSDPPPLVTTSTRNMAMLTARSVVVIDPGRPRKNWIRHRRRGAVFTAALKHSGHW